MSRITRVGAFVIAGAAVLALAGCLPLPFPQLPPAENDRDPVEGPAGWTEFEHCPAGPNDDWVWVEGFPVEAFEAARIEPECGDTWLQDDGDHFVNVTEFTFTEESLDAFGTALEDLGYEQLWDDFAPAEPGDPNDGVGARDYYLDGVHEGPDVELLAIELYYNGDDPVTYTGFIDYHAPSTRALG